MRAGPPVGDGDIAPRHYPLGGGVVVCRTARLDDVQPLLAMYGDVVAWLEGKGIVQWTRRDFNRARLTAMVHGGAVVAESDDRLCGAFRVTGDRPNDWPDDVAPCAVLRRMCVARPFSGRSMGPILVRDAGMTARRMGFDRLGLDCRSDTRLQAFYESCGFEPRGLIERGSAIYRRLEGRVAAADEPVLPDPAEEAGSGMTAPRGV